MVKPKVLVIGLDGGSWRLLDDWIEEGKLPNLKKMIEKGVHGNLRSVIPSVTCPAWRCYSTGKKPENLGAFGWQRIDWEAKTLRTLGYSYGREGEIWDFLNQNGFTAGVINMPLTYPPKKLDGFVIAGPMTPEEDSDYTYPRDLKDKLKEKYDYVIFPKFTFYLADVLDKEDILPHLKKNIRKKFRVARDLGKKVDFLHLTIYRTDSVEHRFWDGSETEEIWKLIDEEIGKIIRENPETNFFIMSDHGMEKSKTWFNLEEWLHRNGYSSSREAEKGGLFSELGITRDFMLKIIRKFHLKGLLKWVLRFVPHNLAWEMYNRFPPKGFGKKPDWSKSKIIPSSRYTLYVNRSVKDKETVKENLREELLKLRLPETGERVFEEVYRKEDIYQGKYFEIAPDLAISPAEYVGIASGIGRELWGGDLTWHIASHIPDGIFIGYGPDIKEGKEIGGAQLVDLAPTVLHTFGLTIPNSMDGKVLKSLFRKESGPGKSSVKLQKVKTPKRRIAKKVKKLKRAGKI